MRRELEVKVCASCGREFSWRRKWARCWDQVRYCSDRCRRRRLRSVDLALEKTILQLLTQRTGTLCPSEVARVVDEGAWRDLMEPTRAAARRLASRELVEIHQKGRRVSPTAARGPIRLARGRLFPTDAPAA